MTTLERPTQLLTRDQAAEFLGIQAQTLGVWASAKRYGLPYIRVGRAVRYRRADLEKWLASRTVGAIADGGRDNG